MRRRIGHRGYTLLEMLIVIGLLGMLVAMVMPNMLARLEQARLPESANQLRGLLQLTRANAMLDGKRYRIRFPREDEIDATGDKRQPIVEVEDDPIRAPEKFRRVLASWAEDPTFERGVRCARVRLGKPSIKELLGKVDENLERDQAEEVEEDLGESFDEGFLPLMFEPDGTSDWVTFLLTDADADVAYEDLDPEDRTVGQLEVIMDGLTGLAWLQRRLYEEELLMMQEHGWPPVLRKDFLTPVALTEENVLEIREEGFRQ